MSWSSRPRRLEVGGLPSWNLRNGFGDLGIVFGFIMHGFLKADLGAQAAARRGSSCVTAGCFFGGDSF